MKEAISFPELSASTEARPAACPRCGRAGMGWHRGQRRPVVDLKLSQVEVVQYQCEACGASVTVTPPGLSPGCKHSDRTKVMSVVLWGLGLSFRDAAAVMKGLGVPISHVGIIFNVREMGAAAMARQQKAAARLKAPVLGADETQVKLSGNGVTVGFLTDPESGEIVGIEILASREGEELARWLSAAAQHFGAKVLVSDDLDSYKPAAEKLGLSHQVCLAHARKAVALRLKKLEGFEQAKAVIRQALKELSPQAKRDVQRLHRHFARARPPRKGEKQSAEFRMRMLTLDLLENWGRLTC